MQNQQQLLRPLGFGYLSDKPSPARSLPPPRDLSDGERDVFALSVVAKFANHFALWKD